MDRDWLMAVAGLTAAERIAWHVRYELRDGNMFPVIAYVSRERWDALCDASEAKIGAVLAEAEMTRADGSEHG